MDGKDGLILWTLGGAGILFLYAAYTKKSPQAVLVATLGAPVPVPASPGNLNGNAGAAPNLQRDKMQPVDYTTGSGSIPYLFDGNGNIAGIVPAAYASHPSTYVPPAGLVTNV